MNYKGNCPKCESIIEVEVTQKNESYLNTCVTSQENYSGVCQADESFYEGDEEEYTPINDRIIQPCWAYGGFYEDESKTYSSNRDEIIIECPICNMIVHLYRV